MTRCEAVASNFSFWVSEDTATDLWYKYILLGDIKWRCILKILLGHLIVFQPPAPNYLGFLWERKKEFGDLMCATKGKHLFIRLLQFSVSLQEYFVSEETFLVVQERSKGGGSIITFKVLFVPLK